MKFKDLYFMNSRWTSSTMLRVRINDNVEYMMAYNARKLYGEKLVSVFYDDAVVLV